MEMKGILKYQMKRIYNIENKAQKRRKMRLTTEKMEKILKMEKTVKYI